MEIGMIMRMIFSKKKSMGNVRLPGERRHKNRLDTGQEYNEELVNKIRVTKLIQFQ